MTTPDISVFHDVHFGYTDAPLFRGISFAVRRHVLTGIIGPNGSGKSTLIKLICGILSPTSGEIHLDGIPMRDISIRARARKMAYLPQQTIFAHAFTVLEVVLMGRYPHNRLLSFESAEDIEIARNALEVTGAGHLADRLFDTLSGGEQQRVVLASALAQAPELLVLDEPTASLDIRYQLHTFHLLKSLNRDKNLTVIVAVHDLNLANRFCDDIIMLTESHEAICGTTTEVLTPSRINDIFNVEILTVEREGITYFIPVAEAVRSAPRR